jgi:hypothetical protein
MRAPIAAFSLAVILGACGTDGDPYPIRPPGGPGGGGSTQPGVDAGPVDAGDEGVDAAPLQLDGTVCVILDVIDPFECLVVAENVDIAAVNSMTSTISGAGGAFTIDLTQAVDVLSIGAGEADGLVTTLSRTDLTPAPITAPVLDEIARDEMLAAIPAVQTTGAMLIYVVDGGGPVAGATVSGFSDGAQLLYDDGAGAFIPDDGAGTGNDGIALIIDTAGGLVTATDGARTANAQVATLTGAFGIGVITLPDP